MDTKGDAWHITLKGCEVCLQQLAGVLERSEGGLLQLDRSELTNHRNALKMHVYLLCQFVDMFENELNAQAKSKDVGKIGRGRGRGRGGISRSAGTAREEGGNCAGGLNLSMDWIDECERAMIVLDQLCRLQLNKLWDPPVIEEDFINLSANCCYKLLENRSMASSANMRTAMTSLLSSLVRRYGHNIACCVKLTQLLKCFSHMPNCLSAFVRFFMEEAHLSGLVRELLKEICSYSAGDLERDTQAMTHFSNFLLDVAGTYPQLAQSILPLLRPRLDEDPYQMRNCVLGVIGEVLPLFARREQLDQKERVQRDRLMDLLQEHIHDVNGYVRAKALQIWHAIVTTRGLPVRRQCQLASLLVGPLGAMFDVSSLARRYACKTLTAMVLQTPAAKLTSEELQQVLDKETKRLESVEELLSQLSPDEGRNGDTEIEAREGAEAKKTGHSKFKRRRSSDSKSAGEDDDKEKNTATSVTEDEEAIKMEQCKEDGDECLTTPSEALSSSFVLAEADAAALFEADIHSGAAVAAAMLTSHQPVRSASVAHAELISTVQRQRACVSFLKEMTVFSTHVHTAVKDFQAMLASKTLTDVTEAIEFYVTAKRAGMRGMETDIQQIFVLVWSQEESIRKAAIEAFRKLYLQTDPDEPIGPAEEMAVDTADVIIANLSQLIQGANMGNLVSIERILQQLISVDQFNASLTGHLWQRFVDYAKRGLRDRHQQTAEQTCSGAVTSVLLLLKMIVKSDYRELTRHLDTLIEHGLQTSKDASKADMARVTCTCQVIQKMVPQAKSEKDGIDKRPKNREPYRLGFSHPLFSHLRAIIVATAGQSHQNQWIPMMEQIIGTIYDLAESPDSLATGLISQVAEKVIQSCKQSSKPTKPIGESEGQPVFTEETEKSGVEKIVIEMGNHIVQVKSDPETDGDGLEALTQTVLVQCPSFLLSRFLSLSGHVCLKQLVHVESSVLTELKRRANVREVARESKSKLKASRRSRQSRICTTSFANASTVNASLVTNPGAQTPANPSTNLQHEEESGLVGAAADDEEADYVRQICDKEMITASNHFFTPLLTLITYICSNPSLFPNEVVQASASLSLAKMMLVTADVCEPRLQLLFTMAERSSSEVVRANLVVALGDLCRRFPNLIEPWTPNLYARLRDSAAKVRTNALNTLSHLILNDMIKVKGQISEMTVCLVDEIDRLNVLARQFFGELAHKGNALYNVMPDIISRLSDPDIGVSEENFHSIMDFLLPLIGRERLCETLVEKICARFRATTLQRQWRDLAHCLSAMSFNDRMMRVLYENLPAFADKLCIGEVYAAFEAIITNAKKTTKVDGVARLEEFENKVNEFHEKGVADEAAIRRAEVAAKTMKQRGRNSRASTSQQMRSPGGNKRNTRHVSTTNIRRTRNMPTAEIEEELEPVSRPVRSTRAAATTQPRRRVVYSSSEENQSDEPSLSSPEQQ